MKRLLPLVFVLAPLFGVGQTWEPVDCIQIPLPFCGVEMVQDEINPLDDPNLFETDSSGVWQYGYSHKPVFDSISQQRGWVTDTIQNYSVSDTAWFQVKIATHYQASWIYFEHKFETDTLKDIGFLSYSCNGENWSVINNAFEYTGFPENIEFYNYLDMPEETPPLVNDSIAVFSGNSGQWNSTGVMIVWSYPRVVGNNSRDPDGCLWNTDSLYFRFNFYSDSVAENLGGWMIRKMVVGWTFFGGSVSETNYRPLDIYPNPATTTVRIQPPQGTQTPTLTHVYDMTGRLVLQRPFTTDMDVSPLSRGTYAIVVHTELGNYRGMIQKQ